MSIALFNKLHDMVTEGIEETKISLVSAITLRRDMGLYKVPLSVSLLGFWDRGYASQLPCVRYYVFVKSSFKHTCEVCESKNVF